MGIVYLATCLVNNKQYIGKTVYRLEKRKTEHIKGLTRCVFHKALRKYGPENFSWEVLHEEDDHEELLRLEIEEIAKHETMIPSGYNMTSGGDGLSGFKHTITKEWRRKNGLAFLGRKHTPETIAKMVRSRTGRKLSAQHRANIIAGRRRALTGARGLAYRKKISAGVRAHLASKKETA